MQPSRPKIRVSMESIIDEAIQAKFYVHAFVLEPGYSTSNTGQYQAVKDRLQKIARINLSNIKHLDARQFALINANKINKITSMI
jgi:hypothetical protein